MKSRLVETALFQCAWIAIVATPALGAPWVGPLVAGAWVGVALARSEPAQRGSLLRRAAIAGAFGAVVETGFGLAGVHSAPGGVLCPPWLLALWVVFGVSAPPTLGWLAIRPFLAIALGAVTGPLAYFAGERLGAIDVSPGILPVVALSVTWAVALPVFAKAPADGATA